MTDSQRAARLRAYKQQLRGEIRSLSRDLEVPVPGHLGEWNAAALIEHVIDLRGRAHRAARRLMETVGNAR